MFELFTARVTCTLQSYVYFYSYAYSRKDYEITQTAAPVSIIPYAYLLFTLTLRNDNGLTSSAISLFSGNIFYTTSLYIVLIYLLPNENVLRLLRTTY